jgi:hypothetical protein
MADIFRRAYASVTEGAASSSSLLGKIGMIAVSGAGTYVLFLGLGVLYAVAFSSAECGKQDWNVSLKESAWWGLYPLIAWVLISIPYIRIQFDKFFMIFGIGREAAVWVSFGYALMLGALAGIIGLRSGSIAATCVPSVDEVEAFRKKMLEQQRAKNEKAKATAAISAASETTPAVRAI